MDAGSVLAIWQRATGRRLEPELRMLFLSRAEVEEIAKFHSLFAEEAARLAVVGDVLRLSSWLLRCKSVAAHPPPHVREALSEMNRTDPPVDKPVPRRPPPQGGNRGQSESRPWAGARYGGMVNPAPIDADLHRKIGRANKGQRYPE